MGDLLDETYETVDNTVVFKSIILGYVVIFREIWFTRLEPHHICAYVRLPLPFRSSDDMEYNYEYPSETYREGDVLGIDTDHLFNQNQNMTQKLEDARRQITDLIQEYIEWKALQNVEEEPVPEPELRRVQSTSKGFKVGDKVKSTDKYNTRFERERSGEVVGIKGKLISIHTLATAYYPYYIDEAWLMIDDEAMEQTVELSLTAKRILNLEL